MQPAIRPLPSRVSQRCVLAAIFLACLALAACKQGDPLEAIRQKQAAGEYEATIEPLRALLAKDADDPETNFLYGRALSVSQPGLATWSLRKAMRDPDWMVPAGTQLAYLELSGNDFNEVEKITSQILEREPENLRALMMRANAYAHSKKDPELALADAKHLLEIDPETLEAYEPMILALLQLERLDEASAALAQAGEIAKKRGTDEATLAWHCVTTADFQKEGGKLEEARKTWLACLEAHPTDTDVVSSAVEFYDSQKEPARSLEVMRAALAAEPTSRYFRTTLAERIYASGGTAEAEAVLHEGTASKDPSSAAAAWLDLGKFRQAVGEYAAAADAMKQMVEEARKVGPPNGEIMFEYADALVLADQLGPALEVANELPVPAHKHLIRGRVFQEQRDPTKALAEFDETLKLWPDNPWARYYAALAAEELGDFERALDEYRDSIRANPSATDARIRGAKLLLAERNPISGLIVLQTEIADDPLGIDGLLVAMRLSGAAGNTNGVADFFRIIEAKHPARVGEALAEAAEGLNRFSGPALAADMLVKAPGADFHTPRYAAALRALVKFSHAADVTPAGRAAIQKAVAGAPDSSVFQDIRGLDLELSGAPKAEVSAAYTRALELAPANAFALAGLGRLAAADDPQKALDFFDRAAAANPADPDAKLGAARALIALKKLDQAAARLDALLLEHPFVAEAALERARLDLEQAAVTPQTLERARRAVRFGGGPDALDVLSQVYAKRNEPDLAAKAAEQARTLREAKATKG